MEIAKLGEFGLIDRLTQDIKPQNESTLKGVGDDCAVLHYPDTEVLVTTDMLMEGVHFDLTYIDLQHLGYKSAMVNISDVFAMNGTPRQITVSMALSKRFTVEDMEQFYSGLRMACDKWNVDIVGGDTTSSLTGLAISITCIGEAHWNVKKRFTTNKSMNSARRSRRLRPTGPTSNRVSGLRTKVPCCVTSSPTLPERSISCNDS